MTLPARVALVAAVALMGAGPCGLGPTRAARAVPEEEWQVGLGLGYASLARERRAPGTGLGLELARGLTDAVAVRGTLELSLHPGDAASGRPGTARRTGAGLGLTYALDVLRVVPWVDGEVLFLDLTSGAGLAARRDLAVGLGAGLDYWLARRWAVGATLRGQRGVLRLQGPEGGRPSVLSVGLRLLRAL